MAEITWLGNQLLVECQTYIAQAILSIRFQLVLYLVAQYRVNIVEVDVSL